MNRKNLPNVQQLPKAPATLPKTPFGEALREAIERDIKLAKLASEHADWVESEKRIQARIDEVEARETGEEQ